MTDTCNGSMSSQLAALPSRAFRIAAIEGEFPRIHPDSSSM